MSRKKKLAVNLGLIVLLGYLLLNINDLYFSQKDLLRVHERANHYGPSEEILVCHENPEGMGLVAGRLEDGNFSAFTTERAFGIFVRSTGGGILPSSEDVTIWMCTKQQCTLIVSQNPAIKEVYFQYKAEKDPYGSDIIVEETVVLDSRGFAFLDDYGKQKYEGRITGYTEYVEGRDADGTILWTSGEKQILD